MRIKEITDNILLSLKGKQLNQLAFATNDGQGDTDILTLNDIMERFETNNPVTAIDILYEDTSGNMTVPFWVENNEIFEIIFI